MRTMLTAVVVALAASAAAAQAPPRFPGTRVETQCTGTWRVAIGDVDLDGHPDLMTPRNADTFGAGFRLVRGQGDGTFAPPEGVPGPVDALLALGDVDGDADADLITFDASSTSISFVSVVVRLADAGSFGEPVLSMPSQFDGWSSGLIPAHFDGDGLLDVLVRVSTPGNGLRAGISQGDGTFSTPGLFGFSAGGLAVSDVDGDDKQDVLGGEGLRVWLGDGGGSFLAPIDSAVGLTISGVVPCDLDADGQLDLLSSFGTSNTYAWRGSGDGHFSLQQVLSQPFSAIDLAAPDLDEDGLPDLLASQPKQTGSVFTPGGLWTERGVGDFTFEAPVFHLTGGSPYVFALADLDTDGHVDVVTAQILWSSETTPVGDLGVSFGRGDGGFDQSHVVDVAGGPIRVALADLDGDGLLDLACVRETGVGPAVALGAGDGDFGPAADVPLGVVGGELLAADLDGDGLADLVVSDSQTLVVSLGVGGGLAFGSPQPLGAGDVNALRAADFDGDGTLDLAAARGPQQVVDVWRGLGGGSFAPAQPWPAGGGPVDLDVADLDGDGDQDLAAADFDTKALAVLFNSGAAAFAAPALVVQPIQPRHVAAADFDGDEDVDLATSNDMGLVRSWMNTGAGAFTSGASVDIGQPPRALRGADANRDGLADLIAAQTTGNGTGPLQDQGAPGQITLLLASPGGALAAPLEFFAGGGPMDLAVGDVDGNGFADFVAPARSDDQVWVLLDPSGVWTNLGYALPASFGTPTLAGTGVPAANEKVTLLADGVPVPAMGLLYLATATALQPLQGGVLVPEPQVVVPIVPGVPIFGRWPAGFPVGAPIYAQAWFATSGGAGMEVSATNALITLGQ